MYMRFECVNKGFVPAINKTQSVHKTPEEKMNIDILMMVATEEEEKAITNYEYFEERELNNGINFLIQNENGLNIALARGFEYGEVDAAIMTQKM